MEEYRAGPRVILDARFVVDEEPAARHLNALEKMGCILVLTDAFSYDLTTFAQRDPWLPAQRKLLQFPNSIECWLPLAEIQKHETAFRVPSRLPVDNYATDLTRHWCRSKEVFVLDHQDEPSKRQRKQKSERLITALLADIGRHRDTLESVANSLQDRSPEQIQEMGFRFVNDRSRIGVQLRREYVDMFGENDAQMAGLQGVDDRWLIFHQAKAYLALLFLYVYKFGVTTTTANISRMEAATLLSDYAILLAFAEGLACNEIDGDLAKLCRWMYGPSRKLITANRIDNILPQTLDVEHAAYYRWEMWGHKHGHDTEHWHQAERELHRFLWPML